MIRKIEIENFKSVKKLELELGRVTILIGANGAGKSNILEGVAFTSAATADKIDNEFLASRGVRVSNNLCFMFNAFASVVGDDTERKMVSRILFDNDGSELSVNTSFISEKNELKYDYIGLYDDRTLDIGGELVDYLSKRKRKNLKDVAKDGSNLHYAVRVWYAS